MVDIKAMRKMAEHLRDGEVFGECYSTADMLDAAASELAERRRESVAGESPTAAERRLYWLGVFAPLVWQNLPGGTTTHETIAAKIANMADAMLAAERVPKVPT